MLLVILKIQNISKSLQIDSKTQMVTLWIILASSVTRRLDKFKIYMPAPRCHHGNQK